MQGFEMFFITPGFGVGIIFCLTLSYAVLRYNICGEVAWSHMPLYVTNKAVSWTGLVLLGCSVIAREPDVRRYHGTRAAAAILAHLILSLLVLNPAYFAKFYGPTGRMNAVGELSMLAGVAGFLVLCVLFVTNGKPHGQSGMSHRVGRGRMVLWCAAAHVAVMGAADWIEPGTWPGYLPPISLLSFLTCVFMLYFRGRGNSR